MVSLTKLLDWINFAPFQNILAPLVPNLRSFNKYNEAAYLVQACVLYFEKSWG